MATAELKAIEYPSSDGQPMAETSIHVRTMMLLHQALEDFFRAREDVFIGTNLFWYYAPNNSDLKVAPDVMVILGVRNHDRDTYVQSEEQGIIPSIVFEITSKGTFRHDEYDKYVLYEDLGVVEYYLFDPQDVTDGSPLKGYRLNGTAYRRMRLENDTLASQFGFRLRQEDTMLRLIDSATNLPILTRREAAQFALAEVANEKSRADQLQAEVERLRAMLQQHGPTNGNGS